MSIDTLLHREYDLRSYNCAHFVRDAWKHVTGRDISRNLEGFLYPPGKRSIGLKLRSCFQTLSRPENPCIVMFRRPRTSTHVGMWMDGRVLHITEAGPQFVPLDVARIGWKTVRFCRCLE